MTGKWYFILSAALAVVAVIAQEDSTCRGDDGPACPAYASYVTSTNVIESGKIDLDVRDMVVAADRGEFATANSIFELGKNSKASEGMRALSGFSTAAEQKMGEAGLNERNFITFRDYYESSEYCYNYVKDALEGTGEFSGAPVLARAEAAVKGAQYQCTLMYVIHEMENALADCRAANSTENDGGAKAWDEAVAFYVGSLVGSSSSTTTRGALQYGLAASHFAVFSNPEDINARVMENFGDGKKLVESSNCRELEDVRSEQIDLFKVPVLQGLIRYAYLTDENGPGTNGTTPENLGKFRGEANAFARALLPWMNVTDPNVATFINENFPATGQAVKDGYSAVVEQINSLYGRGEFETVSQRQVGNFTLAESTETVEPEDEEETAPEGEEEMAPEGEQETAPEGEQETAPEESSGGGLSGGAIAAIVMAVVFGSLLIALITVLLMRRREKKNVALNVAPQLHSNGVTQRTDYIAEFP